MTTAPGNPPARGRVAEALVVCVWNFVRPTNSVEDLEVTKRVAWLLRGSGGGLLTQGQRRKHRPVAGHRTSRRRGSAFRTDTSTRSSATPVPAAPTHRAGATTILSTVALRPRDRSALAIEGAAARRRVFQSAVRGFTSRAADGVEQAAGQVADDAERDEQHRQRERRRRRRRRPARRTRRTPPGWCRCR